MKSVSVEIRSKPWGSRKELLVRLVYWIPFLIVFLFFTALAKICGLIQFFSILALARRFNKIQDILVLYWKYGARVFAYYSLITDERPPILPKR